MTEHETKQILSVLKAAYPNAFKGMNREDALDMVRLWTSQFADIPVGIMGKAVKQVLYKCRFLPTIAEITEELYLIRRQAESRLSILTAMCASPHATPEMKKNYEENRCLHTILKKALPGENRDFVPLRKKPEALPCRSDQIHPDSGWD